MSQPDLKNELNNILASSRRIISISSLSIFVMLLWAYFAEIDEITRAPGAIIASSKTQLIQSQDGGVLEELLVKEGDSVVPGMVLARIDRTRAEAAYLESRAKVAALSAQYSRLFAEITSTPPKYDDLLNDYPEFIQRQESLLRVRTSAHKQEVAALERIKSLSQSEYDLNFPLVASGDISKADLLKLAKQIADLDAKLSKVNNDYLKDAESLLTQVGEELEASRQIMVQRKNLLEQTELKANLAGKVKNVRITTLGGVVRPGEDVMQIVPTEDSLVVEAKVSPSDIAFVKVGMPATVKVDSFDYTIYGDLSAVITYVSPDTLDEGLQQGESPYYRVRLKTTGSRFSKMLDNQSLDVQAGMTVVAEIKTGVRTVLQYLIKPIAKTLDNSLIER